MNSNRLMFTFLGAIALLTSFLAAPLDAHFIWVYQQDGKVQIVFGEGLEPDQAKFMKGLNDMKVYRVEQGKRALVEFTKQEEDELGWFEGDADKVGQAIDVHCLYGVFGRGDRSMLLDYGAKYVNLASATPASPGTELNLDLIPKLENGELTLTAYFRGKPIEGVEVQVEREATFQAELNSTNDGKVPFNPAARYIVRGKYTIAQAGELNGKEYDEQNYYCTLVVDHGLSDYLTSDTTAEASSVANAKPKIKKVDLELAAFPKGMTSFGADVVNGKIYIVGGKSGRAHAYAKSYQNQDVFQLATDGSDKDWKTAAKNLGLQGLAVVGYEGKVYRIGGLEARNKEGDEHDLHSVSTFTALDTASGQWSELPPMPSPRSSLDACVAGKHVYVVGGWSMGEGDTKWAEDMLRFDLNNPAAKWETIPVPFRTRALAIESWKNKLVVIGGIQEAGGTTNGVHVYDIQKGSWQQGPEVPAEGGIKSFGCSCVVVKDRLFVSTYDGGIFALNDDGKKWIKVHQLQEGRFFHQMVPVADDRFALIGGSHMETGSHYQIEVFELEE